MRWSVNENGIASPPNCQVRQNAMDPGPSLRSAHARGDRTKHNTAAAGLLALGCGDCRRPVLDGAPSGPGHAFSSRFGTAAAICRRHPWGQWHLWPVHPITAAGPRWICTTLPSFIPSRQGTGTAIVHLFSCQRDVYYHRRRRMQEGVRRRFLPGRGRPVSRTAVCRRSICRCCWSSRCRRWARASR